MSAPHVLIPWDRNEAITVDEAAFAAKKSASTIRQWCRDRHIGRRVAGGAWMVSHPALNMLLNDDTEALAAYLKGERQADRVGRYFDRLALIRPS